MLQSRWRGCGQWFRLRVIRAFLHLRIDLVAVIKELWKFLDECFDLVADPAVMVECLLGVFGGFGQGGRVVEAHMKGFGGCAEGGAGFSGLIANGDDGVEVLFRQLVWVF